MIIEVMKEFAAMNGTSSVMHKQILAWLRKIEAWREQSVNLRDPQGK